MGYMAGQTGAEIIYGRGAMNAKQAIVNQVDRIGMLINQTESVEALSVKFSMAIQILIGDLYPYIDNDFRKDMQKVKQLETSIKPHDQIQYGIVAYRAAIGLLDRNNLWLESSEYEEIAATPDEQEGKVIMNAKDEIAVEQEEAPVHNNVGAAEVQEES